MSLYDAFISYSHAKDKPIAAALQSVVQKLGKPWYWRRALRVFRDDISVSARPHLWPSIEQALGQSRFFILLACPETVTSQWVIKEIAYWLEHNSIDTLLIAVTDGELVWEDVAGGFHASAKTRLPKCVDLRAYRNGANPRDAKFIELAADFAAAIHGTPKEDLLSKEVRQQRRALTLAWSTAVSLLVLAGAAGWELKGALKAERDVIEQKQTAVQQRQAAETKTARAERNFGAANETVDAVMFDFAYGLRNIEGMKVEIVRPILDQVELAVGKLVSRTEDDLEARRRQAAMFRLLGDTYLGFGDFPLAGDYARKQTQISRDLAAKDPGNTVWQHDLAVSLTYEGDILAAQGDRKGAGAAYREGLNIARRLAANDRGNMLWQRGVVANLNGIGDVLVAQGDLAGALAVYRESLDIARALVAIIAQRENLGITSARPANEPGDMRWLGDVMRDLDRVGDFLQSQPGEQEGALSAYRDELDIARRLVANDSDNMRWKRDVSIVLTKLGFMRRSHGDLAGAIAYCREGLDIARALITKDKSNTEWQTDVVSSLHCLARAGDDPRSRWSEALAILTQIKSQGRLPQAKQGWIGTIEADLAMLGQDRVPSSTVKQTQGTYRGTNAQSAIVGAGTASQAQQKIKSR
jgi:tetratricopeptide (TPR) repeat protein